MHEGRDQRLLDGVRRLFAIAQGVHRDGPEPIPTPPGELAESLRIPVHVRTHQGLVVPLGNDLATRSSSRPGARIVHATVISETTSRNSPELCCGSSVNQSRSLSVVTG